MINPLNIALNSYSNFFKEISPELNWGLILGAIYAIILIDIKERVPLSKYSKYFSGAGTARLLGYIIYLISLMFISFFILLLFTLVLWIFFCLANLKFI